MEKFDGSAVFGTEGIERLRALTFLSPGIPLPFFRELTDYLSASLGCPIELEVESRSSGPMHGQEDPFAEGRADVGFLCSPSYLYLRDQERPSVTLVPAGLVFRDARHGGDPVYYSDVIVRADRQVHRFEDLAGATLGYNDECSLSGYFSALQTLAEKGHDRAFFGGYVRTGSHHASIAAILDGSIDVAAIDSNVLAIHGRLHPDLGSRLRLLESWGPFPIQPIVVRSGLGGTWASRLSEALLRLDVSQPGLEGLAGFGLERCVPIDDGAYVEERRALCALGELPPVSDDARRPAP